MKNPNFVQPQLIDIQDAEVTSKGRDLPEGHYLLDVEFIKYKKSNRLAGSFFIVEFSVVHVFNSKPITKDDGEVEDMPSVGDRYSCRRNTDYKQTAGDIKAFMAVCSDIDPDNAKTMKECGVDWNQVLSLAVSEDNPFRGTRIECWTSAIITQTNKRRMMTYRFKPYAAKSEESAA